MSALSAFRVTTLDVPDAVASKAPVASLRRASVKITDLPRFRISARANHRARPRWCDYN